MSRCRSLLFVKSQEIKESQRGKFPKHKSPMEDQVFRNDLRNFILENARPRGGRNLTLQDIDDYVTERLEIVNLEDRYSLETIRKWVKSLGIVRMDATKKVTYYDGHNRPDNVIDRARLFRELSDIEEFLLKIDPKTLEVVNRDTATMILIVQDETIKHSNETQKYYYGDPTKPNVLPPKSQGARIMSSDFITVDGYLMYNETAWARVKSRPDIKRRIEKVGEFQAKLAGRLIQSEYYDSTQCCEDFWYACDIIKENYNGKYTPVFLVDHSPIHKAISKDALCADSMNLTDGGKQRLQRPTYFDYQTEEGQTIRVNQSLVFEEGEKKGQAKGLKTVCLERYGPEAIKDFKFKRDYVERLKQDPDFSDPKPAIQEIVEQFFGRLIFSVKFHPEFSAIECLYRDLARFLREWNIIGTTVGFMERYERAIQAFDILKIRRYFLSAARYLEAYNLPNEDVDDENINEYYITLKRIQGLCSTTSSRHRPYVDGEDTAPPKIKKKHVKSFLLQGIPGANVADNDDEESVHGDEEIELLPDQADIVDQTVPDISNEETNDFEDFMAVPAGPSGLGSVNQAQLSPGLGDFLDQINTAGDLDELDALFGDGEPELLFSRKRKNIFEELSSDSD